MRILFVLFFALSFMASKAQPLEPLISVGHGGSVTIIGMQFIDDTLWVSGLHRDNGDNIIWKYNENGTLLDSTVFPLYGGTLYNFVPYGDSVVVIGVQAGDNDKGKLVLHCLDRNLDLVWSKFVTYDFDPYIMGFRHFRGFQRRFVEIQTGATQFFKFDKDFNFIEQYKIAAHLNFEPIKYTDHSFHFGKGGAFIFELDTTFNVIDTLYLGLGVFSHSGNIMSNGKGVYVATSSTMINNEVYYEIHFRDSTYQVVQNYPYFGHSDDDPRYTYFRSMAPNPDTSRIFASGYLPANQAPHPVHLGSYNTNEIWVSYLTPDSMLWHQFYADSTYYYFLTNMTMGPDGSLYLASSRYNVSNQPDYSDAVIFKFNAEGDMLVGNNEEVSMQRKHRAYPNPGTNYLNVEIPEVSAAKLYVYNLQGKMLQMTSFRKKHRLNTSAMPNGIYIYKIVSNSGNIYSGKWIKK
ncbi:hypothetical protein L21SP5_01241 [Salinivirga cyanobacteriivorans]|uniref:Secretion system C-terminal sorting domain-containing protein n=1 Tax=Salinivirga cyanobacteriivorans TaxID=1307839 RepID=A0A0S2HXS9_9BACT|nr:T9SS type A sorting domain-containing protein [Salinivirga cyanobacteriivorans]ALO14896.1 hypothetical protein L21SP5_01241 [Salinivirga cyanobacteriivorans]